MLLKLFLTFSKIGAFTIGGGYAMLSVIENEVVDRRKWIPREDFLDLVVLAQTAPGILAVNISILTGNKIAGRKGAIVSAFGAVLPSFISIILIAMFFTRFQDNVWVRKAFSAIRPAVIALIAVPVFSLAKTAGIDWKKAFIPVAVALLIWRLKVSPIYLILLAIAYGIAAQYYKTHKR